MPKYVSPSIELTAFNCPTCGTLTSQYWFATGFSRRQEAPGRFASPDRVEEVIKEELAGLDTGQEDDDSIEKRKERHAIWRRLAAGEAVLTQEDLYASQRIGNLHVAKCYECGTLSVWLAERLMWPPPPPPIEPHDDMPEAVRQIYLEAGQVLMASPRAAAALLRLALETLCRQLTKSERQTMDQMIGTLVGRGLDRKIQMALDIVRVTGNASVHPGAYDLEDNRQTADELFRLLNLIVESMISGPKHVEEMYGNLDPDKRDAIERRNQKAIAGGNNGGTDGQPQ